MGGLDRIELRLEEQGQALDEAEAEQMLRDQPNALLLAVLLDQQIRAETAFVGPYRLAQRLGHFDAAEIAELDEGQFQDVFSESPAIHRYSSMMAERTQNLMAAVVSTFDGDASTIWTDADDAEVAKRLKTLPGFGPAKVKTLLHALAVFGYR